MNTRSLKTAYYSKKVRRTLVDGGCYQIAIGIYKFIIICYIMYK